MSDDMLSSVSRRDGATAGRIEKALHTAFANAFQDRTTLHAGHQSSTLNKRECTRHWYASIDSSTGVERHQRVAPVRSRRRSPRSTCRTCMRQDSILSGTDAQDPSWPSDHWILGQPQQRASPFVGRGTIYHSADNREGKNCYMPGKPRMGVGAAVINSVIGPVTWEGTAPLHGSLQEPVVAGGQRGGPTSTATASCPAARTRRSPAQQTLLCLPTSWRRLSYVRIALPVFRLWHSGIVASIQCNRSTDRARRSHRECRSWGCRGSCRPAGHLRGSGNGSASGLAHATLVMTAHLIEVMMRLGCERPQRQAAAYWVRFAC